MSYWYEKWPQRLKKEKYEIEKRHPELHLFKMDDGKLYWKGKLLGRVDYDYNIIIVYPKEFPLRTPKVYPINTKDKDFFDIQKKGYSSHSCHLMGDGSLCLAFPIIESPHITAADVADFAIVWLRSFENYIKTGKFEATINMSESTNKKIQIKIENSNIGLLNTGKIEDIENLDVELTALASSGKSDVANAIKQLSEQTINSKDIDDKIKTEVLEQLQELAHQASLEKEKRISKGVLKSVLSGIGQTLSAAGGTAEVWSTWGQNLIRFFGV